MIFVKKIITDFLNSKEDSLDLDGDIISSDVAETILIDFGYEYGEEQDSDGVRYSQFHHDEFDSVTIKQRINRQNYEIIKD